MPAAIALIVALTVLQDGPPALLPARLVFEGASKPHFSTTREYVELREGRGVLLISEVYSDVNLSLDFRRSGPEAEAELFLANMPTGRVRLRLPSRDDREPDAIVSSSGLRLTPLHPPRLPAIDNERWQQARLQLRNDELRYVLNGTEVGRYHLPNFVGHVGFRTEKGSVQFRSIMSDSPAWRAGNAREGEPGIVGPKVRREVKPDYSAEALRARIEGIVIVEALVLPDGSVGAVRMMRPLPGGLDRMAVEAARQWLFEPATRDGRPHPVWTTIEFNFRI